MAEKIERLVRDFLWHGASDSRKDHLVSWDVCCKSKQDGGLEIGILVSKTVALVAKWLRPFPIETSSLWEDN